MAGQWIGRYSGSNNGLFVVELDSVDDHYEGTAVAWDDDPTYLVTFVSFQTTSQATYHQLDDLETLFFLPDGTPLTKNEAIRFGTQTGVSYPEIIRLTLELQGLKLEGKWDTPMGTAGSGSSIITKTRGRAPSSLKNVSLLTWSDFKSYVQSLKPRTFIFRGQEDSTWRLRTSFHRTERACIHRYTVNDIPDLKRSFSSLVSYPINYADPIQYAAFLHSAQHHGYPTSLLDRTWSPYVAAYFAFRLAHKMPHRPMGLVRVFKFDASSWNKIERGSQLCPARPSMWIVNALAYGNSRTIPQQGIMSTCTTDDIESHIEQTEAFRQATYLEAVDIRVTEHDVVMRELALMGITAAALFPGLDGACEALRIQNFGHF